MREDNFSTMNAFSSMILIIIFLLSDNDMNKKHYKQ
jgi:hypothetical protein